ncbi:VRR-NUC domain-containing protein [Emcibacter sp. SYSU 3D8]|uniref:VRR-NUC domain-containing protein n=1 Tax=Emcibacter sp. SYSU 3D8 TaxID=3133969 RepID=UPI0031FE8FE9
MPDTHETRETRLHREAVDLLTFLERQERLTWLHPADGLALSGSERERLAAIARFRRLGMRGGVPDLIVAARGGLTGWVELKTGGGRLSRAQAGWSDGLRRLGHNHKVVRDMDGLVAMLRGLGVMV